MAGLVRPQRADPGAAGVDRVPHIARLGGTGVRELVGPGAAGGRGRPRYPHPADAGTRAGAPTPAVGAQRVAGAPGRVPAPDGGVAVVRADPRDRIGSDGTMKLGP